VSFVKETFKLDPFSSLLLSSFPIPSSNQINLLKRLSWDLKKRYFYLFPVVFGASFKIVKGIFRTTQRIWFSNLAPTITFQDRHFLWQNKLDEQEKKGFYILEHFAKPYLIKKIICIQAMCNSTQLPLENNQTNFENVNGVFITPHSCPWRIIKLILKM